MKAIQWLASNWFIILVVAIVVISVYFSIRTYRTLNDVESESDTGRAEPQVLKRYRFLPRIRSLLAFAVLILGVSTIIFSVVRDRIPPTEPPGKFLKGSTAIVKAEISNTANFGDDLKLTLTKITLESESSSYRVDVTVRYKDEGIAKFTNAKEGAIMTFPPQNGYDIEVVRVNDRSASFSITKN